MRINNNLMSMNTYRQYSINTANAATSTEKLSSGYRINRAGDDAAGLAISEKMRAQIRGLNMASKNSQDAISLVQTAEGALTETHSILQRMRELAVQSASDTNDTEVVDRTALNEEFQALKAEIDDIASKTAFNGKKLLDGSFGISLDTATTAGHSTLLGVNGVISASMSGEAGETVTFSLDGTNNLVATKGSTTVNLGLAADLTTKFASANGEINIKEFGVSVKVAKGTNATTLVGDLKMASESVSGGMYDHIGSTIKSTADFAGLTTTGSIKAGTYTINAAGTQATATLEDGSIVTLVNSDPSSQTSHTFGDGINSFTITLDTAAAATVYSGKTVEFAEVADNAVNQTSAKIQTGANSGDELTIAINRMDTDALELTGDVKLDTQENSSAAIETVNTAINTVSTQRSKLGAIQNRLQHKINNLDTTSENLTAAESRVRDLDMAKEMTNYTKNNILVQAATAMLAQANSAPQGVLQLLQ